MHVALTSLLRRSAPVIAVLALAAPAHAGSNAGSPDPAPGSSALEPDAAPQATKAATPARVTTTSRAPVVVRTAPSRPVSTSVPATHVSKTQPVRRRPAVHRTVAKPKPKPAPSPAAVARALRVHVPALVLPRPLLEPLHGRSARSLAVLAALALAAAALTSASGAGLVASWSRR